MLYTILAGLCMTSMVVCEVLFLITNNASWVDRIWSIAPVCYAWVILFHTNSPVSLLLSALITLWGLRLTYNTYRKGQLALSHQDYRYTEMAAKIGKGSFGALHLFAVAIFQNALLLLLATPAAQFGGRLGYADGVLAAVHLAAIATEAVADQQQWDFQLAKKNGKPTQQHPKEELERGFVSSGLFRYCRHPNFAAEITIWWTVALIGYLHSERLIDFLGAALLTGVFAGSTQMTEGISSRKYKEYAEYQKSTPMLLPNPFVRAESAHVE